MCTNMLIQAGVVGPGCCRKRPWRRRRSVSPSTPEPTISRWFMSCCTAESRCSPGRRGYARPPRSCPASWMGCVRWICAFIPMAYCSMSASVSSSWRRASKLAYRSTATRHPMIVIASTPTGGAAIRRCCERWISSTGHDTDGCSRDSCARSTLRMTPRLYTTHWSRSTLPGSTFSCPMRHGTCRLRDPRDRRRPTRTGSMSSMSAGTVRVARSRCGSSTPYCAPCVVRAA